MKKKLRYFILRQLFRPGPAGFLMNPFYLGRAAMYLNIRAFSGGITGKTLDVGCGSKPYAHLFRQATEYTGMDVKQSGHRHQHEYVDVWYDGRTFPFGDNTFDSLVFFEVIEHVFEPDDFLREICRVVKPGGHCLVTVPFTWGEHEQPFDYARYSSFGLRHLFQRHGLEVVRHRKYLADLRLIFLLVNSYIYTVLRKLLGSPAAWLFIAPLSAVMNGLGLLSRLLPGNSDLYFGNIFLLRNNKEIPLDKPSP